MYKIKVYFHSFACQYPVFLKFFVEKPVVSPLDSIGTLAENHLTIYMRVYFGALYSIGLHVCL